MRLGVCLLLIPSAWCAGALVFDNPFGGSRSNSATGIALDSQGNIYVAGQTNSTDFPLVGAVQNHPGAASLSISSDGGQTFTSAGAGVTAVYSIAAAAGPPVVIYAATDIGVIKSNNGGSTWSFPANTGLPLPPSAIAADSGSTTTVYAATPRGLYISTDGAASWTSSISVNNIVNVVSHPGQPGTVFVMAVGLPFLSRSTDSGQTWTALNIGAPNQPASPNAMVFDAANPAHLILGQKLGSMLQSTDGGDTWTQLSTKNVQTSQGLTIDPANNSTLYLVGLIPGGGGVYKSIDGGQTFTPVLSSLTNNSNSIFADPRNPGTLYVIGPSGFYRSPDGGQSWVQLPGPNPNAPFALLVSPLDSRVLVGSSASQDVFVAKWSRDGKQLIYSTYLGGSGIDYATGIAVDSSGSAYVTGYTSSLDFPVTSAAFQQKLSGRQNAFVAKLSPDGSRLSYSTLFGGGAEATGGIAVDAAGSAVITGTTQSNFPATPNAFQATPATPCTLHPSYINFPLTGSAFAAKLAPDGGSLIYATLLGGSCGTSGSHVAIGANGDAWVTGTTVSPDFPVTPDALQSQFGGMPGVDPGDGFLARFDPSGQLKYATYLGGQFYDAFSGITLDASGNIFLTGVTGGFSVPPSPGAFQARPSFGCPIFSIGPPVFTAQGSAFVMKLNPKAAAIIGLTYLGAPCSLGGTSIAVDATDSPWIGSFTGFLPSSPLPTAHPFQIEIGNGLLSKFSADLTTLEFSSYMDSIAGVAVDVSGLALIAGAGPITGPISTQKAYVAKVDPAPPAVSLDMILPLGVQPTPGVNVGIAPGMVIRLTGKNLGPAAAGIVSSGLISTGVAGVQVTFDGIAAPLLSLSPGEIQCIVPFEIAGRSATTVQVQNNGINSNPVEIQAVATAVEVLNVLNEDFTTNSASNPAQAGSIITLYISGAGQTNPPSQDGQLNSLPLAQPGTPITVRAGGPPAPVTFAAAAAGLAAGVMQVNFVAPQQSTQNMLVTAGNSFANFSVAVQ